MNYLVIDVGGTFTKYAVMDEDCHFYKKDKTQTIYDTQAHFLDMLEDIFVKNGKGTAGIALSSAGFIDSDTGVMYNAGSLRCVSNINIAEILQKRCGIPVTVENDARCAALAELWRGSLTGYDNGAVIICGTAVGGAIILNGKILRGKRLLAGEFSYLRAESSDLMNPEQAFARAGSVRGLIRIVSEKKHIAAEELNGEKIFAMANDGDEEVLECIRKYADRIVMLINNCQYIFDPDRIAVGGGISAQPLFIQMIREELENLNAVFPYKMPIPEVVPCRFFNDSNLIGALYVHLQSKKGE